MSRKFREVVVADQFHFIFVVTHATTQIFISLAFGLVYSSRGLVVFLAATLEFGSNHFYRSVSDSMDAVIELLGDDLAIDIGVCRHRRAGSPIDEPAMQWSYF